MRPCFQEENTLIIFIAGIYRDFYINRMSLKLSEIKNGEGVSWDGDMGHAQILADTGILVNK